jgi:hypothetical protein
MFSTRRTSLPLTKESTYEVFGRISTSFLLRYQTKLFVFLFFFSFFFPFFAFWQISNDDGKEVYSTNIILTFLGSRLQLWFRSLAPDLLVDHGHS